MTCDTLKTLERECSTRARHLTIQQAYRSADNQKARDAWAVVMEWTGPQQKITGPIWATFMTLMKG